MAKYVLLRVKVVKEFGDINRSNWGAKYFGVFGENDERSVLFDADNIVDESEVNYE